jgi:transposase
MAELKLLTRDYHKLARKKTQLVNQLRSELKAFYPRPGEVFEDLATQTCLDFLKQFSTPETLEALTLSRWRRFAKPHKMGDERLQELWEKLKVPQLSVRPHVIRAKSALVQVIVKELEVIVPAVQEYKRKVEDFFASIPASKLTRSLPGGKSGTTIPTLWAELGDAQGRWESFRHLQAHAGSTPITDQSGKHKQVFYRYACNKLMRYSVYWLAQFSLNESEWAREYYDRQRERGHKHSEALRALGAKWLKIIFVMWRDQVPYSEDRHLANLYRQQPKQQ